MASFPYGLPPPGYRLPAATHVGSVRLQVRDLERSLAYYTKVIGLRVVSLTADTGALAAHGDDRPLVRLQARPGLQPAPRRGAYGLYHFTLALRGTLLGRKFGLSTMHLEGGDVRMGATIRVPWCPRAFTSRD